MEDEMEVHVLEIILEVEDRQFVEQNGHSFGDAIHFHDTFQGV